MMALRALEAQWPYGQAFQANDVARFLNEINSLFTEEQRERQASLREFLFPTAPPNLSSHRKLPGNACRSRSVIPSATATVPLPSGAAEMMPTARTVLFVTGSRCGGADRPTPLSHGFHGFCRGSTRARRCNLEG
jgi:hypothetical protein